ncbi:MAG: hypothetical protein RSC24_16200 [Clostridium sp.]
MNLKSNFESKVNTSYKKHKIKKEQEFYEDMLKEKRSAGGAFFSQKTLVGVVLVVTILLQIISLATTFKGSKVYFGGIKLPLGISAAFLFALSIQTIVFYVGNTLRTNMRKWLMVVLAISVACSTYFSYIGIYNFINSPISYLNERYSQIYDNLSGEYYTVRETQKNDMKKAVFNLSNEVNSSYISLGKTIEKNNGLKSKLDAIEVSSGNINAQTYDLARPNVYDFGDDMASYYAAMTEYNQAVGNMISDATNQDSSLKNDLYQNEVKSILGGKTEEEFLKESIETQTNKESIEKSIEAIYLAILPTGEESDTLARIAYIEKYCQNFIASNAGDSEVFTTAVSNMNALVTQLGSDAKIDDFQGKLNRFVVVNKKDKEAMRSLDDVKLSVYNSVNETNAPIGEVNLKEEDAMLLYTTMATEIRNIAYTLNQVLEGDAKIDLESESYILDNLYVLPVKNLISSKEGREMAWFCLAFAMLVDGLTIIFALTNGKKNKILFAKSNREIMGKSEESMEDMIILSLMSGEKKYQGKELVVKTSERLVSFIIGFSLLHEGIIDGYSMWCPINNLSKYQMLIATLCQFNLAAVVKEGEIYTNKSKGETNDVDLLLIKTKFAIWANDKIATLELNSDYIDSINSLEKDYIGSEVIL